MTSNGACLIGSAQIRLYWINSQALGIREVSQRGLKVKAKAWKHRLLTKRGPWAEREAACAAYVSRSSARAWQRSLL